MTKDRTCPPTLADLRTRRRQIGDLARRRGVTNIKVFGSVARGDARDDSDVDLLVEFEPGRSVLDLGGFSEDLTDLLGRSVHVMTPATLRGHLDRSVLNEALVL